MLLWSMTSLFFAIAVVRIGSVQLNITRQFLALIFLILVIYFGGYQFNLQFEQYFYLSLSGFIGLTFGDSFLFLAYREIGARLSMLIMSLSPAIAALLAYLFLGESIKFLGIVGIVITLIGIMILIYQRTNKAEKIKNSPGVFFAFLASVGQGAGLVLAKQAFNYSTQPINGFVATSIRLIASLIFLVPASIITHKLKNSVKFL